MNIESLIPALYVFVLAAFLGYQVISRVPPLLHTPLMSATNAISGISLVGSIVTAGAQYNQVSTILGFVAVTWLSSDSFSNCSTLDWLAEAPMTQKCDASAA